MYEGGFKAVRVLKQRRSLTQWRQMESLWATQRITIVLPLLLSLSLSLLLQQWIIQH